MAVAVQDTPNLVPNLFVVGPQELCLGHRYITLISRILESWPAPGKRAHPLSTARGEFRTRVVQASTPSCLPLAPLVSEDQ
jgi:hypothetical protein